MTSVTEQPATVSLAEFDRIFESVKNWGRWGPDDQLGTLNYITPAKVREAALTSFFGWSFAQLAAADDDEITELTQRVRWWSRVVRTRGVAALLESVAQDTRLAERLLSQVGGERQLTDLRHIGQSLHAAMVSGQLGIGALVAWLRERITEARASTPLRGAVEEAGTSPRATSPPAFTSPRRPSAPTADGPQMSIVQAWKRLTPSSSISARRTGETIR